jgi:hypothetical protein
MVIHMPVGKRGNQYRKKKEINTGKKKEMGTRKRGNVEGPRVCGNLLAQSSKNHAKKNTQQAPTVQLLTLQELLWRASIKIDYDSL